MRSVQMPPKIDTALQLATPPLADTSGCVRHYSRGRPVMRDLIVELRQLRLHGMAWHGIAASLAELLEQGNVEVVSSQWLLERLLQAECADPKGCPLA